MNSHSQNHVVSVPGAGVVVEIIKGRFAGHERLGSHDDEVRLGGDGIGDGAAPFLDEGLNIGVGAVVGYLVAVEVELPGNDELVGLVGVPDEIGHDVVRGDGIALLR